MEKFDIVVIGSGPGGYRAAVLAALRGARVAVVEKGEWGGCCLNRGCVPKKIWHHTADLVARSRGYGARGIAGALSADLAQAWIHQRSVVQRVRASYLDFMHRLGIAPVAGTAELSDARTVAVQGEAARVLKADYIILATGAVPRLPAGIRPVAGRVLTTDMLYDEPPPPGKRVAIVGGGVVGVEFAYILAMLGCEVRWFTSRAPLARHLYSRPARTLLAEALSGCGVTPIEGARVQAVEASAGGVVLRFEDGRTETADWLLLGTGRTPYTAGLGLARAGVETDARGFVRTDAYLRTTASGIYAIGDCVSTHMTANQALADATLAVSNILEGNRHVRDPLWVPEVIYSAVILARVGMDEDLAEQAGHEPAVGFSAFEASPAALGEDDARGFVRLLADMDTGELLGGEVAGTGADEIIHLLCGVPERAHALPWFARLRVNHPTRAEECVNAVETLARQWGLTGRVFGR